MIKSRYPSAVGCDAIGGVQGQKWPLSCRPESRLVVITGGFHEGTWCGCYELT